MALTAGATRVILAKRLASGIQQKGYPPSILKVEADQDKMVSAASSCRLSTPRVLASTASDDTFDGAQSGPLPWADDAETSPYSYRRRSLPAKSGAFNPPPTRWTFKVETSAVSGPCPAEASALHLCAESEASLHSWVQALAESIQAARSACYRLQPSVPPEEFGTESLLADGCLDDHGIFRYEAGLLGHLEQTQP